MLIMTRCCCCDVRLGTIVVAIWWMMVASGGFTEYTMALVVRYLQTLSPLVTETIPAKYPAFWSLMILLHAGLGLTAALLPFGILNNKKKLLLPFIAMMGVTVLAYVSVVITTIVLVSRDDKPTGIMSFGFLGIAILDYKVMRIFYGFIAVVMFINAIIGILSIICVLSQYQEMSAGRGRGREIVSYNLDGQVNVVAQPPNAYVVGQTYVAQPPNTGQDEAQTWKPTYS